MKIFLSSIWITDTEKVATQNSYNDIKDNFCGIPTFPLAKILLSIWQIKRQSKAEGFRNQLVNFTVLGTLNRVHIWQVLLHAARNAGQTWVSYITGKIDGLSHVGYVPTTIFWGMMS